VAVTQTPEVCRALQLFWGVEPIVGPYSANTDEMMEMSVQAALDAGCISQGDSLVLTAGIPIGKPGSTNMIKVINLGRKILSGSGIGKRGYPGEVCVCRKTEDFIKKLRPGMVLVVDVLNEEDVAYAAQAGAIIAEEGGFTSPAAILGINYNIPVIIGAANATDVLTDGRRVTLDTASGIVYDGIINIK
jgi:pyruvate kinase